MNLGSTAPAGKTQNRGNEAKKSLKTKEVSRKTNPKRTKNEPKKKPILRIKHAY